MEVVWAEEWLLLLWQVSGGGLIELLHHLCGLCGAHRHDEAHDGLRVGLKAGLAVSGVG